MANQALRQEINLIDKTLSGTGTVVANDVRQLDLTAYSGSPTFWFEACYNGAASNTGTIKLLGGSGVLATINGATSTTYTISRAQFTPSVVLDQNMQAEIVGDGVRTQNLHAARILILQSETAILGSETQIEVGNAVSALANTTVADITNPKFWKYNSANWDGSSKFYVEVVWTTSAKNTTTITLCRTSDNAANVTIVNAGSNSTGYTRTRVAFTPVNGETYKIRALSSTSKSTYSIACATIIVDSNIDNTSNVFAAGVNTSSASLFGGTAVSSQTNQALGQSFTPGSNYTISTINLFLLKVASPADNLTLEILTTSMTGTVIGTSAAVAGSGLTTVGGWIAFAFSPTVALTASTKYYLRLTRSGARDTTNAYTWAGNGDSVLANGGFYVRDNNTWGSESATIDLCFNLAQSTGLTKLEPQALLLNTGDAGTGAQNMFTTYNDSEWNVGTGSNTITHLMDSDNSSNSAKIVTTAGADTGSSSAATGATQAESGSFTLIDATNYDTNVTNSTGVVAGSRLKFVYVFVAAVARRIFVTGG